MSNYKETLERYIIGEYVKVMAGRTKLTIMLGDGVIATELDKNVFQIGSRVRIEYNHKYQGEHYGTITERFSNRGTCMVEFKESILEWRMRDLKLISEDEFQIGIIMEM